MAVCCRILFFLNTNIDNVGLCRLSVSIYLTPLGNWFFSFCWQSGLFFAHYHQSVNPIQTLLYVQARMLFFLNKNSDNVRPCRLSVGIYFSLLGNCFFVLLVVRSIFRHYHQSVNLIQTLLQLIRSTPYQGSFEMASTVSPPFDEIAECKIQITEGKRRK